MRFSPPKWGQLETRIELWLALALTRLKEEPFSNSYQGKAWVVWGLRPGLVYSPGPPI